MKRIFFSIFLLSQFSWAQNQDVEQVISYFESSKVEWQIPLSKKQTTQNIVWQERISSLAEEGIRTFVGYVDSQLVGVISIYQNSVSGNLSWLGKNYVISTQKKEIIVREDKNEGSCSTCEGGHCSSHKHLHREENDSIKKSVYSSQLQMFNSKETPNSLIPSDEVLRIYRLAILLDYSAVATYFDGNKDKAKAFWAETEVFLNEAFTRDVGVKFTIVNDDRLIITEESERKFPADFTSKAIMNFSTLEINRLLGNGDVDEGRKHYDAGVSIAVPRSGSERGIATLGGVYTKGLKGAVFADAFNFTISHELGHLFGADHTFTIGGTDTYQTEPERGTSIMSYGQYENKGNFFSLFSINQMRKEIAKHSWYYTDNQRTIIVGSPTLEANVVYGIKTDNKAPIIDRNYLKAKYLLPPETSFQFDIKAKDPEGKSLMYWVHQTDFKYRGRGQSDKTKFYSHKPQNENIVRFDPQYYVNLVNFSNRLRDYTQFKDLDRGEFTFWVAVADTDAQNQSHKSRLDAMEIKVEVKSGTPFILTSEVGNSGSRIYNAGQKARLTWNVDKSIFGENSRIRILMSDDFGKSWKYTLVPDTENDGSHEIIIPDIDLSERIIHDRLGTKTASSGKGLFRIEVIDHIATAITDGGAKPVNGGFEIRKSNIQFTEKPAPMVKVRQNELPWAVFPVRAKTSCSLNPEVRITHKDEQENNRITRIWTAIDDCGNTAYIIQYIEIENDVVEPLKWIENSLPENQLVSCQSEIPAPQNPSTTGGKGQITITSQDTTPNNYCNATIVRTYTATDEDGKSITLTQNIKVEDNIAPTWNNANNLPQNLVIEEGQNIPAQVDLTATDNCGVATVTKSESRENGRVIYTWTATDACGNRVEHTQTITINPKPIAPITWTSQLPQNVRVSCAGNVPNAENLTATGGQGLLRITHNDVRSAETCANKYVITRTYTATDGVRSIQHTQTIEVNDDIAPSFVGDLPQNITIEEGQNVPTQANLTAIDNCGVANVETSEREVLENGKLKQKIYTWVAKDVCGNQIQHEQIIEIKEKKVEVPNKLSKPKLYPNPTNDSFQLSIENVKGVKVYNTAGRLVKTFEPQQKYDISNLTSEVYIIAVETENGTEYIKLIKN